MAPRDRSELRRRQPRPRGQQGRRPRPQGRSDRGRAAIRQPDGHPAFRDLGQGEHQRRGDVPRGHRARAQVEAGPEGAAGESAGFHTGGSGSEAREIREG